MNYMLLYLEPGGRAQQGAIRSFQDDTAALKQARNDVSDAAVVEVWNDHRLIARLFRDPRYSEGQI